MKGDDKLQEQSERNGGMKMNSQDERKQMMKEHGERLREQRKSDVIRAKKLRAQGLNYKEIGTRLNLSANTVRRMNHE